MDEQPVAKTPHLLFIAHALPGETRRGRVAREIRSLPEFLIQTLKRQGWLGRAILYIETTAVLPRAALKKFTSPRRHLCRGYMQTE